MSLSYCICFMVVVDCLLVICWVQQEGFCLGIGDVGIFCDIDDVGVWVGEWEGSLVGCIVGICYDENYGFIGLFFV